MVITMPTENDWQNRHPQRENQGWFWYWHPDLGEATPVCVAWSPDPEDYGWRYIPQKYPANPDDEWWKPMGYDPSGPELPDVDEEDFNPNDDLGTPPNDPTDLPRDHPLSQPKPGCRPADK
jgi:hypothetical protein